MYSNDLDMKIEAEDERMRKVGRNKHIQTMMVYSSRTNHTNRFD